MKKRTQRKTQAHIESLRQYIEKARLDWNVPGLAFALIKDNKILINQGFGVKNINSSEPVDSNTYFAIASMTKAFTTSALSILADKGIFSYDRPVIDYQPDFTLFDSHTGRDITTRDLVTHRSGLRRHDLLWYLFMHMPEQLIPRLRHVSPSQKLRYKFIYNNNMFITAGKNVKNISGLDWTDFVSQNILQPLNMHRTNFNIKDLAGDNNVASPHIMGNKDKVTAIAYKDCRPIDAAGCINSCVNDMIPWINLHLNLGLHDGKRLISEKSMIEMHAQQFPIVLADKPKTDIPKARFYGYGLGWMVEEYRGLKVVHHGGNMDGMTSILVLVPELNSGFVLLSNRGQSWLREAIWRKTIDTILSINAQKDNTKAPTDVDWNKVYLGYRKEQDQENEKRWQELLSRRIPDTKPSLHADAYEGIYSNAAYGEVKIIRNGDDFLFSFEKDVKAITKHWHLDTFQAHYQVENVGWDFFSFAINERGKVTTLLNEEFGDFQKVAELSRLEKTRLKRAFFFRQEEPIIHQYRFDPEPLC
jgi:CubicO group peptidase (beta-lactamase class C family)